VPHTPIARTRRGRPLAVPAAVPAAVVAAALALTGCSGGAAAATGVDEAFVGGTTAPSPEATITPEPGSWTGTDVPAGYRVALVSAGTDAGTDAGTEAGTDAATGTIVRGVQEWAEQAGVDLVQFTAADDEEVEDRVEEAVAQAPDLVLGAGTGIVDVFTLATGQYLDQPFLVLGAQLAEPTANVTAVVWPGATFRGTGLAASGEVDPASVTPARVRDAVAAGVASVLRDLSGIVIDLG